MTPMIDMVFLLLVFFMTVSTLAQADKLVVDLPESSQSDVPEDLSDRGTISLDADGLIYLAAKAQTVESMQRLIKQSLAVNPELRIQVRADQATAYADIKKVLRACAEVGAYEVIYSTYQSR